MSGVWADTGIQQVWTDAMNALVDAACFKNNVTPSQSSTLASLNVDTTVLQSLTGWSYSLNTTTHIVTASKALTFTFSSISAGNTYYGVAMYYTSPSNTLCYAELFPAPYTVPSGGGSIIFTANLQYKDCSS